MKWNLTVSDQCCMTCNNTAVPIDTYINTVQLDNKCGTVKWQYCRKFPKAKKPEIVIIIKHKHCCADSQGQFQQMYTLFSKMFTIAFSWLR